MSGWSLADLLLGLKFNGIDIDLWELNDWDVVFGIATKTSHKF